MIVIFSLIRKTLPTHLFRVINNELVNIKDWFTANKLPLNVKKTKYSLFRKQSKEDDIPLHLPKFIINNYEMQRVWSFIGPTLNMERTNKAYCK